MKILKQRIFRIFRPGDFLNRFLMSWFFAVFFCFPSLADTPLQERLQGLWKSECKKRGEYWFIDKYAFFEDVEIHSWQWYSDPLCLEEKGDFWDKWRLVGVEASLMGQGILQTRSVLMDGYKKQCPESVNIISVEADRFYSGDKHYGTENDLGCMGVPVELDDTPYLFVRPLIESMEEYIKSLRRDF